MVAEHIGGSPHCVGAMAPASDASSAAGEMGTRRRGLWVNNSLTKEKVPFVTKDGSKNGESGVLEGCLSFLDAGIEVGFFFIASGVPLGGN